MEKTPKELFIEELLSAVGKFENKTGAEVHGINFVRLNRDGFRQRALSHTVIGEIKLALK